MRLPSLFKIPQHRRFQFKPRYYDPRREALAERLAAAGGDDGAQAKARIRRAFGDRKARSSAGSRRAANGRLAVIVVVLCVLFYLIFF